MKRIYIPLLLVVFLGSCAVQQTVVEPKGHKTAEVKRAMVSIDTKGGSKASVGCVMQTVFDSLCVVSVQPLAGMEVAVMYATPDNVLVVNRMQRCYCEVDYALLNTIIRPMVHYEDIEQMTGGKELSEDEKVLNGSYSLTRHYAAGKTEADITITYPAIIYDQELKIRPERIEGYKKVDIRTFISHLK